MRKLLFGLIGMVVAVAAAVLILPGLIDWNGYKPDLIAEIRKATGRDMRIDGDLDLALLPSPRLSAAGVRIANVDGAAAPDMVRLEALGVRIRLRPLLSGRIEVESMVLIEPAIELERLRDGRVNWVIAAAAVPGPARREAAAASDASDTPDASGRSGVRLENLRIRNGAVTWRDSAAGTVERLTGVDAAISAESLSGPFRAEGGFVVRGAPIRFSAALGRIDAVSPAPMQLGLEVAETGAEARLAGALADVRRTPRLTGRLSARIPDPSKLAAALAADAPPWSGGAFSLSAEVDASAGRMSLDGLELRLGPTAATGRVAASFGEEVRADVALVVKHVDFDDLRRAARSAPQKPAGAGPAAGSVEPPPSAAGGFRLPGNVGGALRVEIESARLMGGRLRGIELAASLDDGRIALRRLSLHLPGEAEVALAGALSSADGEPAFEGGVEGRADNVRALLGWLGIDLARVPADRLRKVAVKAGIRVDRRQLQATDIDMWFDASRVRGGVTYAFRERAAFGARFNVDQFNVDAYVAPAPAEGAGARPADDGGKDDAGEAAGGAPSTAQRKADAPPLAALAGFDANLDLRIGALNYRGTPFRDVVLDATVAAGALTLRRAHIGSVAGTSATVTGSLGGFDGQPWFKGNFSAASEDPTGLLRLAGIEPSGPARRLGRLALRGRVDSGPDETALDATLDVAGGKLRLVGSVAGLEEADRHDLVLAVDHPDAARLARLFGLEIGAADDEPAPFALALRSRGARRAARIEATLKALDVEATLAGEVADPLGAFALNGTLAAAHPNYARLMGAFDVGLRLAGWNPGAVSLSTALKAGRSGIALEGLAGRIGPVQIGGGVQASFAAGRPRVTADLAADRIPVDLLFPPGPPRSRQDAEPPSAAPAAPGAAARGERFSRAPLDLPIPGGFDADLALRAQTLTWRGLRIDEPRAAVALRDRVLRVDEFVGRTFGGGFEAKGEVENAGAQSFKASLSVDRVDIEQALSGAADFVEGRLDLDLTVAGSGRSERALISSLDGKGRLGVRGGAIRGFDLRTLSDRFKRLRGSDGLLALPVNILTLPADLLAVLEAPLEGGKTGVSSLDGAFTIGKGVLRADDLRMEADAGRAEAAGTIDLPRWWVDAKGRIRLTEHRDAPPLGVALGGPLDGPDLAFDLKALEGYLLRRGIGSVLERALPIIPRAPSPAPPGPAPKPAPLGPRSVAPEDVLKGLLEGLVR